MEDAHPGWRAAGVPAANSGREWAGSGGGRRWNCGRRGGLLVRREFASWAVSVGE